MSSIRAPCAAGVDARLDGERHARLERLGVARHDVGVLVHLQADAVPGAVDEVLAVAGRGDRLPGRGVHRLRADARPDRRAGGLLGVLEHLVVRGELRRRLADRVGPGAVRAVAAGHGAADVHHDRVARAPAPGPDGSWCGLAAFGPEADDHEVGPGVALGHDRVARCRRRPPARSGRAAASPAPGACTRSIAAPASRSAATSAGVLRIRSPRSAALARPWLGAGQRGPEPEHHQRPHPVRQADRRRTGPSRPATSAYGSSVSSQATISRPRPPAGEACAAGSSSRGTTRNGGRPAGHRQAGQPLQLMRVVAGHVAQVRARGEQQRAEPGRRRPPSAARSSRSAGYSGVGRLLVGHEGSNRRLRR